VGGYDLSKIGKSQCRQSVSLSVGRSVGQSVSQSVSYNQSERKKEKSVFPVTGKVVIYIYIIEGRRKEAEGSINIGKCQDSRRRPIYTTTLLLLLNKPEVP